LNKVKIIIGGAKGKLGSEIAKFIYFHDEFDLVACTDSTLHQIDIGEKLGLGLTNVYFYNDLSFAFKNHQADIYIDVTNPSVVKENVLTAIKNHARPIIGTSGLSPNDIKEIKDACENKKIGGMLVPNFSIGAILMMEFSQIASKYYNYIDIVEKHAHTKKDAPSGTAKATFEKVNDEDKSITIHSMRAPSFVAHQEVIFSADGETLTIKHDSLHRKSFLPGVELSVKKVLKSETFSTGLDLS
jgi:4-hydroxy-tetrahydrodipicolinate reductase